MPKPQDPILIVDDDINVLSSVRMTLETDGYTNLVLCSDSRQVGELLIDKMYSLMLLDLSMPYITGNEILRSVAGRRSPPIVVVAGSARFEDFIDGVAADVFDYLLKPVDRGALLETVRRALASAGEGPRRRLSRDYLLFNRVADLPSGMGSEGSSGMADLLSQVRLEYRRLLRELPTPYVVLEAESFRIRFHNSAFAGFLASVGLGSATPASFLDLFEEPGRVLLRAELSGKGELIGAELRGRGPAGTPFVLAGSFRVNVADGYVEGGFVDITERTLLKERLARSEKLEALGALAGGVAHDLSNLLLVVGGFAELILTEPDLPPTVADAARHIAGAVANGGSLVRQVLAAGREPAEDRVPVSLHDALRASESGLRLLLRPGQALVLKLEAGSPVVEVGRTFVDQVFRNLVLNARDAMPAGGTITISTSDCQQGVALEVRDTGTGMDEATLSRIFEPLFTTKERGKGSGLGLSTVRSLVRAAGGSVDVESAVGAGSVFRIHVPRARGC